MEEIYTSSVFQTGEEVDAALLKALSHDEAIERLSEEIANIGTGGGLSNNAKTLLMSVLRQAVYTANVSSLLSQLESALSESGGDAPEAGVEQVGNILYIVGGVAVSQSANILEIM